MNFYWFIICYNYFPYLWYKNKVILNLLNKRTEIEYKPQLFSWILFTFVAFINFSSAEIVLFIFYLFTFCLYQLECKLAHQFFILFNRASVASTATLTHTYTPYRASPSGSAIRNPPAMQETQEMLAWSLGQEDPLEEHMETHSSILAWRIPWSEEPRGLQVHRVAKSKACMKWLSNTFRHTLHKCFFNKTMDNELH